MSEEQSQQPEFLVDIIIPSREIHLLAGPSGAGKTRWLLNILKEWEQGKPFLGFPSHPCKWAYAATDRSMRSVHRTMKCLDIDPSSINIIPAWGSDKKTLPQIIDHAANLNARLLVIESFGKFADGINSGSVESHLNAVQGFIDKYDFTIIGVVESPKMKPNERYENPRQRVSGCAAWAHFTETIFLVEPTEVQDPKLPGRNLFVCPRNAPGMIIQGAFDSTGKIIFTPKGMKK